MAHTPTRRKDFVKVGDSVVSAAGMFGIVQRVVMPTGNAYAVVKWENGYTGRAAMPNIRRATVADHIAAGIRAARRIDFAA